MTRVVAGVFGRTTESSGSAVRRSLEPDASEGFADKALALAWTGGPQPSGSLTILIGGRIQNLRQLSGELGADSELDQEHVLSLAHDRWGEDALARLRGSFVIVVWDPIAQQGLLAVDQIGSGGLFLHESGARLSFATELSCLVHLLANRPAPAPASVVRWLADGYLPLGATLFDGIRRLESGHLIRLDADRWHTERYWTPRYVPPARSTRPEATAELEAELKRSVRERLAEAGTTGVLLSGGLDSSTVAAIASQLSMPAHLRAYSIVYPDHPEMDESTQIHQVTRALGIPVELMPMRGASTFVEAFAFQFRWEVPPATPMLAFNMPLLRQAAREGIPVVIDGEGGDELFGCSSYLIADRLRHGNVPAAIALARQIPGVGGSPSYRDLWALISEYGVKGAMPYGVHRILRRALGRRYVPPWLNRGGAELCLGTRDEWEWKQRDGPRWWSFLADLLIGWRERLGAHDFLRQRGVLAGVECRHPLFDDLGLIELALRLPPDLAFDAHRSRPLLRSVVAGVLPDEIRLRGDKANFNRLLVEALSGPDRAIVDSLLGAGDAEIWRYVQPEPVRHLVRVPDDRRSIDWARVIWRLATMEVWLRSQGDREFPTRMLERHGYSVSDVRSAPGPRRAATS